MLAVIIAFYMLYITDKTKSLSLKSWHVILLVVKHFNVVLSRFHHASVDGGGFW